MIWSGVWWGPAISILWVLSVWTGWFFPQDELGHYVVHAQRVATGAVVTKPELQALRVAGGNGEREKATACSVVKFSSAIRVGTLRNHGGSKWPRSPRLQMLHATSTTHPFFAGHRWFASTWVRVAESAE